MLSKARQDHYDVFNRLLMMEYGMMMFVQILTEDQHGKLIFFHKIWLQKYESWNYSLLTILPH